MRHSTQQDEYILDGTLVIEEYIDDGEEYSVEVLTTNGRHEVLAITTKEVVMPYFIEAGHLLPAPLKMEDREAIQETVCSLLTSIGHLEGPSHTEIKLRRGIPYIIESHTRYGGNQIWDMVRLTTGVNMQRATVCHLLDIPYVKEKVKYPFCCIKLLLPQVEGKVVIMSVNGVNEAEHMDGIHRISLDVGEHSELVPATSNKNYIGYFLGGGSTPEEAAASVEHALSLIRIETASIQQVQSI
ncbi:hypothetical protein BK134_12190 [Paenibacillus peoriae]|nr:hypothetical protein BK119_13565 [Paenibacillus peoriae]OMF31834.1 hypothetical protein BK134_12190 [Paenibacillus peoriae]